MYVRSLNGSWQMKRADESEWLGATVPGSVYSDLLAAGRMDDPFYRDNEDKAFALMQHDYRYRRAFDADEALLAFDKIELCCEGLDTFAQITLNGQPVGDADNMHRTWRFDVGGLLQAGENTIEILFRSPLQMAEQLYREFGVPGSTDATRGFPSVRKAHCMYGWDWGPRLPDAGIWRDISLRGFRVARLESVLVRQRHEANAVALTFAPDIVYASEKKPVSLRTTIVTPDGDTLMAEDGALTIENPQLWWPNNMGEQPLYTVRAELYDEQGELLDVWERRIGLRTITVSREPNEWGENFAFTVNGVSFFAMGADYIPEDNLLSRVTPERTRALLQDAIAANFNSIRVWGGGYYPDDWFYDACDELGLVVWQDFMFACASYNLSVDFAKSVKAEAIDNVLRIRHHASLGLWCANNEIEEEVMTMVSWNLSPKLKADYIRLFEYLIPCVVREHDPDAFFWPSSPSSGGGFDAPQDPERGDVHYWDVWHGNKPFTEYRKFFFRYVSEFGFQSFPCERTIESFTLPKDRNIFSYVMEKHQRNGAANGKILNYLSQTFLYPGSFSMLLYASQLLQAEAIRYGVEHWRRNRGRCMGAIYWQLNDCWPVASWASIDYFGRWKALHYFAKRFFAPVLLSCEEHGTLDQRYSVNDQPGDPLQKAARLNVSNETKEPINGTVRWALRDAKGKAVQSGQQTLTVAPFTAEWLPELAFPEADPHEHYISYELWRGGACVSQGTELFCAPKHYSFRNPELALRREGDTLYVKANSYARRVEIVCLDGDVLLEDNDFDLNADERAVRILRGEGTRFTVRSEYDIR